MCEGIFEYGGSTRAETVVKCKYCGEGAVFEKHNAFATDSMDAKLIDNVFQIINDYDGYQRLDYHFNYCPMCGKKL